MVFSLQKAADSPLLDRMTDTSKYTGSHKERFDESGKGKGLAGRDSQIKGMRDYIHDCIVYIRTCI